MDAVWTVEPKALLEPTPSFARPKGNVVVSRAGARFEAHLPGTYTVRAMSQDGRRVGVATIEVKATVPPTAIVQDLPSFPEGFSARSVVALPDGTLVAGGGYSGAETRPALLELPLDAGAWSSFADLGTQGSGAITRVVLAHSGDVFALHDREGVFRVSAGGAVDRVLEGSAMMPVTSIWGSRGDVYAVMGDTYTYVFDPGAPELWWNTELWSCPGPLAAANEDSLWQACAGSDLFARMEPDFFFGRTLGAVSDLALDGDGHLIAATARGVLRLAESSDRWEHFAGGGPSGGGAVLLRAGERLFAGDGGGLWAISGSGESWVRVSGPSLEGWQPFFLTRPAGGIVVADGRAGGAVFEVSVGE